MTDDPQVLAAMRLADQKTLVGAFHASLDESHIRHLWRQLDLCFAHRPPHGRRPHAGRDADLVAIGEGLVFRAWRIKSRLATHGERPGAMDLVLKIPHSSADHRLAPSFRAWRHLLDECPPTVTLVPPCVVLEEGERFCLVMPFAADPLSHAKPHWQPLAERLVEFSKSLRERGLEVNDPLLTQAKARPQAGCWQGIPFMYDLSELRLVGRRG